MNRPLSDSERIQIRRIKEVMMKKHGFTLVELLVVIAILAVLLAILTPALKMAREKGKTLKCLTNLRQLVVGWIMYSDDNDDYIPSSYNYNPLRGWGNPEDWAWAPWRVDGTDAPVNDVHQATEEERKEGIRRGSMFAYTNKFDMYHCPSDQSFGKNLRSYSMPDGLNGLYAQWDIIKKRSLVKNPVEAYVFLEENDPRGYNINSWVANLTGNSWWDPLTVWHGGGSNLGFADGHGETRLWSDETKDIFMYFYAWDWGIIPITPEGIDDLKYLQRRWPRPK